MPHCDRIVEFVQPIQITPQPIVWQDRLVDMLHLFQPDLTIIDGLVGGEGNCPAPVDPVDGDGEAAEDDDEGGEPA